MRHLRGLAVASLIALSGLSLRADEPAKPRSKARPTLLEARFFDGSSLKLALREEAIELISPYGRLRIPVSEIRRIDLANRTPPELAERIAVLIADLGNPQFAIRESATVELDRIRDRAYHALVEASKHKDAETAKRARDLVERVRADTPEERLEYRPFDVVTTAHSRISGRIEAAGLRAHTTQFGDVLLKLTDLRTLRNGPDSDAHEGIAVINDPGSLHAYQGQMGAVLAVRVTGNIGGSIWGSDVYTLDSQLATAAVHAGQVKPGQTAVVRIKIRQSPPTFQGSSRHGVTSSAYGPYPAAFEFVRRRGEE